jgi:hypothetical protein
LEREYRSCDQREYHEFLYEEDNKVYFYDSENSAFKMLYDYDMEMGEEKEFESWPGTGYSNYFIRIDAIDILEIDNRDFKIFTVSYGIMGSQEIDYFLTDREIIEQIGSKTNYFHFEDAGLCDWQYNTSLRCFSSVETNTINYDGVECDLDYFVISNSNIDDSPPEEMIVYLCWSHKTPQLFFQKLPNPRPPPPPSKSHPWSLFYHYAFLSQKSKKKNRGTLL